MSQGIYTSLSGSLTQNRMLEIIANNLANVNTTGYKEDKAAFKVLESEPEKKAYPPIPPDNYKLEPKMYPLIGNDIKYVGFGEMMTNMEQGTIKQTDNPLDIAIDGKALYEVLTSDGVKYTRQSAFTLGPQGVLQTPDGQPLQGQKGSIFLKSSEFRVGENGEIIEDDVIIDQLKLVEFKNDKLLQKIGNNYFIHNGGEENILESTTATTNQGYTEGSNVNALQNLTQMIIAQRSYEAYQKAIKMHDELEGKANSLSDVRV